MQATHKKKAQLVAEPPALHTLPLLHATDEVEQWLKHYWAKLNLPTPEGDRLAITQDRREFARWTGRRLNPLALGCYCYLPGSHDEAHVMPETFARAAAAERVSITTMPAQLALPGLDPVPATKRQRIPASRHRHLIFIEPSLEELGTEVTVAHELIHLADRVRGKPRRHHCHGYDAIAVDEAAITGYDPEMLRQLLRDETARREATLRVANPFRYLYVCPKCGKEYSRVRRYPRPVSCGSCDRVYNPKYLLVLKQSADSDPAPTI
jgi:hypothetical protein